MLFGVVDLSSPERSEWVDTVFHAAGDKAQCHSFSSNYWFKSPSEAEALVVCGEIRLHNRKELIASLGQDRPWQHASDAELVMGAYANWGEQCASRLLGEFAFCIWDSVQRSIFCCRDHMGTRPFLYFFSKLRFICASEPEQILVVPGVPRELDQSKFALIGAVGGRIALPEQTFHRGIECLPPATWMMTTPEGSRKQRYWEPDPQARLSMRGEAEIATGLRHLLIESVACRSEGLRHCCLLSGGLDSSSVSSIAALLASRRGEEVTALCAVPPVRMPGLPDERHYALELTSLRGVRVELVSADPGHGPFDEIDRPELFTNSPGANTRSYVYRALEAAAAAAGAQITFAGGMGELGPSTDAHEYYLELAAGLRWVALARELGLSSPNRKESSLRFLARQVRNLVPRAPSELVLFSRELKQAFSAVPAPGLMWPDHRRSQAQAIRVSQMLLWRGIRAFRSIYLSCPLIDKRVIEFCLAAPGSMKVRQGYDRCLIRTALEGIVPRAIQWRTNKVPFSPDYFVRYNAQLPKVREFVAAIRPNDPVRALIDVDRLRTMLAPVADPVRGTYEAQTSVPATIYAICFLRQFAGFRA